MLAVDGGNSKTDLALVRGDGALLAHVRGPQSSPHHLGLDGCLDVLQGLLDEAVETAGLTRIDGEPVCDVAHLLLAGVDFPDEEQELWQAVTSRGWSTRVTVGNDTFAVLRAGTEQRWGVAIVCGAGINCIGVAPDGAQVRFPALGAITGDWGGGYDVGLAALSAAARSGDGRGPVTSLERSVPAHFGLDTPLDVARELHRGRIGSRRLVELAPLVFAEAAADPVAGAIVDRLAVEIVALAAAALARLGLQTEAVDVVLGGGLIQAGDERLLRAVDDGLRAVDPRAEVRPTQLAPVVGAALLGLDEARVRPERRGSACGGSSATGPSSTTGSRCMPPGRWSTMAEVRFEQATRIYPGTDVPAVDALDLHIADGELLVLVGPSGSGKSTALRMLAGLEEVDTGGVWIGDRDVTYEPPKKRDVAMVFQSYALYPYLTVAANMAFPLKMAKVKKSERDARVREVAELLELTELLERKPGQLSGGQRQRVAMGRAIVRSPQVFLMDEPLSNLDAKLRLQMRADIAGLQARLGVTTVYVTHDQSEAMTLGHRVAVLPGQAAAVRHAEGAVRPPGEHVRRRLHRLPVDEPLHHGVHGGRRHRGRRRPHRTGGRIGAAGARPPGGGRPATRVARSGRGRDRGGG